MALRNNKILASRAAFQSAAFVLAYLARRTLPRYFRFRSHRYMNFDTLAHFRCHSFAERTVNSIWCSITKLHQTANEKVHSKGHFLKFCLYFCFNGYCCLELYYICTLILDLPVIAFAVVFIVHFFILLLSRYSQFTLYLLRGLVTIYLLSLSVHKIYFDIFQIRMLINIGAVRRHH